jgi:GrpB-like predicted nucleotidyltransferase (UPF0157 family)
MPEPTGTAPRIAVVPYRAEWPLAFAELAGRLRAALGEQAIAIHHIGSTAVPGLDAKDVLDLQVTVRALSPDLDAALDGALGALGFERRPHLQDHCPPGMALAPEELEKRMFKCVEPARNLHVRVAGRFNQRYALLFRDYLRAEPMARDAYGEIKRQLARYFPDDLDAYYDIKDPVCDALIAGALGWAKATGWAPGASEA